MTYKQKLTLYTMSEDVLHDNTKVKNIWTIITDKLKCRFVYQGLHTHPAAEVVHSNSHP